MEKLKIVINGDKNIAKKAKEYFRFLGYYVSSSNRSNFYAWSLGEKEGDYYASKYRFNTDNARLVTIDELRDIVVLKRNLIDDATHVDQYGDKWRRINNKFYFYSGVGEWDDSLSHLMNRYDLKPIEKEMKEYLVKNIHCEYVLVDHHSGFDVNELIEIPEGAEEYKANGKFYKENGSLFYLPTGEWTRSKLKKNAYPALWHRHTHPEELPFMDDEPSLNDQYAEIETARQSDKVLKEILEGDLPEFDFEAIDDFIESNVEQGQKHSHYKKDVSHLNVIDIYRVTEMFKPHSCGAHIAKKALCSGQRGHKDLLTDIQDIIDTAERWKEMLIEDENSCKD